jgi:uncharacterized repeat protein (TIGR04076 family)
MAESDLKHNAFSLLCKTALMNKSKFLAMSPQKGCRYHKESSRLFHFNQLTPNGLCIHAFHSVYPACLKLLYAHIPNEIENTYICPDIEKSIQFKVFRTKHKGIKIWLINRIKYSLKRIARFVRCDYQIGRIFIKVIGEESPCPMGHKIGDIYEFNIGDKKEVCPAAVESLYPVIYSLNLKKVNEPSLKTGNKAAAACVNCPSHIGTIKYDISE